MDLFHGGHVEHSKISYICILHIMLPVDQILLFLSAMIKHERCKRINIIVNKGIDIIVDMPWNGEFNRYKNPTQACCCNYRELVEDLTEEISCTMWMQQQRWIATGTFSLHYGTADQGCMHIIAFRSKQPLAIHLRISFANHCEVNAVAKKTAGKRKKNL